MKYEEFVIDILLIISGFSIGGEISKKLLPKEYSKKSYALRCIIAILLLICLAVYIAYMYIKTTEGFYGQIFLVCLVTISAISIHFIRSSKGK